MRAPLVDFTSKTPSPTSRIETSNAAAEIPDEDRLVTFFIEPVRKRCRGRLVDNAQHFEAGNLARIFGCLTLCIVEVCGHRDHRFGDALAEIVARVVHELLQDHRADLLRRVIFAVDLDAIIALTHVALDGTDRALGIGDCLTLRKLAYEALAGLCECNDRRGRTRPF